MNGLTSPYGTLSAGSKPYSKIVLLGIFLAVLAGLGVMTAGLGYQWQFWSLGGAFSLLEYSAYLGLGTAAASVIGAIVTRPNAGRKGFILAIAGLIIGLIAGGVPYLNREGARQVPPIHDITTDTENPPRFSAILPLRADARNSAQYGGPEIAAQQRGHAGYADIQPAILDFTPFQAFERAERAASEMGWRVIESVASEGRIEATDTTFWFGFTDDIVIRVGPTADGSRLDIRSVSRVGRSDAGTNAKRIRAFLRIYRAS